MAKTEEMKTEQMTENTMGELKKNVVPAEEKKVTIKLPLTRTESDDVVVGLNGKTYLIKRGVPVDVPEGVAEILQHREEMLAIAIEFENQAARGAEELDKR